MGTSEENYERMWQMRQENEQRREELEQQRRERENLREMGQAPPERREWKLPEPEPPPREHRRDTSPINWSGVIDQRIAAEHAFMIEVIGQAMGELREQIETNVRKEFEEQLRSLSVELCDRENSLRRIAHQQHRAARAIDGHGNTIHLPVLPLRGSRAN